MPITRERVEPPQAKSVVEQVSLENFSWFFKQCEENRALLQDIHVVVPVRPSDGMNCILHRRLSIWYGEGTSFSNLNDHMGGFIECTRANIAYNFLRQPPVRPDMKPCNYLLMIDNDMEPPVNLPYLLARHRQGVVGACALSIDQEWGPQLCFTVPDVEGAYRFPCLRAGQPIPARGLMRVGHVGSGALMVRRDVLEKFSFEDDDIPFLVPNEFRVAGAKTGTIGVGEDIYFCNQVRAKGVPMFVDLEAHCGHRKTLTMSWDDDMRDPYLDVDSWKLPTQGKEIKTF